MALATASIVSARATGVAPLTTVTPTAGVPDNCETIMLYNRSGSIALYAYGLPGVVVDNQTTNKIPAGGSVVLGVGSLTQGRQSGVMDNDEIAGSGLVYGFITIDASPWVDITYVCRRT